MHHRLLDPGGFMRAGWRLAQNPRLRRRAARRRARLPLAGRLFYLFIAPPLWLFLHAALAVLIVLFLLMPVFWLFDLT